MQKFRRNLLWALLALTTSFVALECFYFLFGVEVTRKFSFYSLVLFLPVLLVSLHACWTMGYARGLIFLILSAMTGTLFEVVSLRLGVLGSHYIYVMESRWLLSGVPLQVSLYWAVFIYTGYSITSSLFLRKGEAGEVRYLPFLILLDGMAVTAIDLLMDPLQILLGNYLWIEGGPYFGVPLGNFLLWFLIATLATGIFRVFEYLHPRASSCAFDSIDLIPILLYILFCLAGVLYAVSFEIPELAMIGAFVMLPLPLVSLLLYFIRESSPSREA